MRNGAAVVACALFLSACGSGVVTPARTAIGQFFDNNDNAQTIDPELLRPEAVCPVISIQPDTESVRRETGTGDDAKLRWQASITRTARECNPGPEGTAIRVGVAGRIVEGPEGAPSRVELPLRIAVREGGEVTYSRLHAIAVDRDGPSQDWAFVDENVVVKNPAGAEIFVGFDG